MKLAKLSLAAIVVAGLSTSSFAADTLADAFKNGKVSGQFQAYYWTKDTGTGGTDADIFTAGLDLSFETATLNGFGFKATFQSAASPFADGTINVDGGKDMFKGDMYGSGAVLSEAYVSYAMKNTTALVGRMYLDTPLVASSGSRVTKQSFEGAAIINTDLPNTTLIAGYVQKFQDRTDGQGNIGQFSKTFGTGSNIDVGLDAGAFTVAAINKSIAGLTLTGAYAQTSDVSAGAVKLMDSLRIAYAEAAYEGSSSKVTYGLAAQYYYNSFSGVDAGVAPLDSNNLFGFKASVGYDAIGAYIAYSKVNNKTNSIDIVSGLGGGADLAYTGSPILSNSYANDTEAYKVAATYALMKNANIGVSYTVNKIDSALATADSFKYLAFEADYAFEGLLKGLSTALVYEDESGDDNDQALRLNINYKF